MTSTPSPVRLAELDPTERSQWLARMEDAFTAGLHDAGIAPGEEPIPTAAEMEPELRSPDVSTFQIVCDDEIVGGAMIGANHAGRRRLELFFIDAGRHGGGIGARAWAAIEARYPDTDVWETDTPYFDQRNVHFYINRCGFQAVEFFHPGHQREEEGDGDHQGPDRSFRFEKRMPRIADGAGRIER
ncbi:GNAT family N-acetyltransferase [Microbacterium dextranolyticum]|uniref:N-acetyltransferase domain-containing protein n=1 Tax=Microbacterium dextranolyticum TaxID=36806 RepID=A0A9W6HN32_9MICO|nr:GNAT family N-acetyltransferase [Microbacterium dextranolyticum]MBM7462578.1 hypothetical protein [Microbacterium dextranolyticum]GLJ96320.1 hypothetical protein GCM10017591_23830 [Microbacterium dextranolyticum]